MAASGLSSDRIEIHFDVHEPVELTEMTLAFQGLGRDYKRFLRGKVQAEGGKIGDEDIKLYITKIESNCILAELAGASNIVGAYFSLLDYQTIFIEYVKHFDVVTGYFKNLAHTKNLKSADIECTKAGAQAIESVMALVAKTKKGKFALRARAGSESASGHKVYAEVELTSDEAAQVQRGALIAQKVLDYRGDADHKNVLMYFQRTSTDDAKAQGRTDDKAIIRSISDKALPVHFASQLDQERINDLKSDPHANPFKAAYRVDVNVEVDRKGVPRFYRVVHLHEIMPEEDDDDAA
jgi:hypothetical protein